jgi:hypothetical protein
MSMCVCVCMCVYVCMYAYVCIYVCMYVCVCIYVFFKYIYWHAPLHWWLVILHAIYIWYLH